MWNTDDLMVIFVVVGAVFVGAVLLLMGWMTADTDRKRRKHVLEVTRLRLELMRIRDQRRQREEAEARHRAWLDEQAKATGLKERTLEKIRQSDAEKS